MNGTITDDDALPILDSDVAIPGSKDGRGIGGVVDERTLDDWVKESLESYAIALGQEKAFKFGVRAECRFAGQSFFEAESELRSEWSSERGQMPWDRVRDAVWVGFDRARHRRV
jgi:hypothetical protein